MGGIARRRALPPPLRPAVARNRARLRPARTRNRRHHPATRRGLNLQRATAPPPPRSVPASRDRELGRTAWKRTVCEYGSTEGDGVSLYTTLGQRFKVRTKKK